MVRTCIIRANNRRNSASISKKDTEGHSLPKNQNQWINYEINEDWRMNRKNQRTEPQGFTIQRL